MIDRDRIRELIQTTTMSHAAIGAKVGCSERSAWRIAKELGLSPGPGLRGPDSFWSPVESEAMAYVLGSYITDGYAGARQLVLSVTSSDFVAAYVAALKDVGLHPAGGSYSNMGRIGTRKQTRVSVYSTHVAVWVREQCEGKSRIPPFIMDGPTDVRLAFVAGAIDGDGHVTKVGSIRIGGVDRWLDDIPALLNPIGVRTIGPVKAETLPSGRTMYRVSIRRSDYRACGGTCRIPEKAERIANAFDVRGYRGIRPKSPCPDCGEPMTRAIGREQCRSCYLRSARFVAHLKRIAPMGNIAGNKARWGHS